MKNKNQKGRIGKQIKRNVRLIVGHVEIRVKRSMRISLKQWETIKKDITSIDKTIKVHLNSNFTKNKTKKGILVRMGKGKGKIIGKETLITKNVLIGSITAHNKFLRQLIKAKIEKKYPYILIKAII